MWYRSQSSGHPRIAMNAEAAHMPHERTA
jgi:hypothetical protein